MLELYHLKNGRWQLGQTFGAREKAAGIEESKRIANEPGIEGVLLVAEKGHHEDGSLVEHIVYKDVPPGYAVDLLRLREDGAKGGMAAPEGSVGHAAQQERKSEERSFLAQQQEEYDRYLEDKKQKRANYLAKQRGDGVRSSNENGGGTFLGIVVRLIGPAIVVCTLLTAAASSLALRLKLHELQVKEVLSKEFPADLISGGTFVVIATIIGLVVWRTSGKSEPLPSMGSSVPAANVPLGAIALSSPPSRPETFFTPLSTEETEKETETLDALSPETRTENAEEVFSARFERLLLRIRRCMRDGQLQGADPASLMLYTAGVSEAFMRAGALSDTVLKQKLILAAEVLEVHGDPAQFVAQLDDRLINDRAFELFRRARYIGAQLVADETAPDGLPDLIDAWTHEESASVSDTGPVPEADPMSIQLEDDPQEYGSVSIPASASHSDDTSDAPGPEADAGVEGSSVEDNPAAESSTVESSTPEDQVEEDVAPSFEGDEPDVKGYGENLEGQRDFAVIMFTDIVNSTALQEQYGDEWNIDVVRAHNRIARFALSNAGGREIKHTGDGMMAKFHAVPEALTAALAMQHGFRMFSETNPTLAFGVRIGLHAGEPLHESGDLYGAVVNLTARITDKAGAEEISVTSTVRDLARGKDFQFAPLGTFDLKGVSGAQTLYFLTGKGGTQTPAKAVQTQESRAA